MPKSTPVTDHKGNTYPSIAQMCKEYNINPSIYRKRIKDGKTIEQALTEKPKERVVTDPYGNKFKSVTEMCRHYNVTTTSYYTKIKQGISIEDILLGK